MGTTIFAFPLLPSPGPPSPPLPPLPPPTPPPPTPFTMPALTRFHLARRFWNQIFTWTSLSFSWCAMCDLSVSDRYFLLWNSFSSSSSCSLVKAVRLLRWLLMPLPPPVPPPLRVASIALGLPGSSPYWAPSLQQAPSDVVALTEGQPSGVESSDWGSSDRCPVPSQVPIATSSASAAEGYSSGTYSSSVVESVDRS